MASYMAMTRGLLGVELDFVVAHDFVGLKKGIADDLFDVFLWETFTTKPDFDAQVLRKVSRSAVGVVRLCRLRRLIVRCLSPV